MAATFAHPHASSTELQPTVVKPEKARKREWAELPKEILEEILSHLYAEDVRSFRLVCRSWHGARVYVFQKEDSPLVYPVPQSQWLLNIYCSELLYQFIHPVYPNVGDALNLLGEAEVFARHSKDGWLLMSSGLRSMFFFSLFPKKVVIELPDLPSPIPLLQLGGFTFTCGPTSSTGGCIVFHISSSIRMHVSISTIRLGKEKWEAKRYVNNIPFSPSYNNPVFHKEMFYCSSQEGNLGVYNHVEDAWTVLEKPLCPRRFSFDNYLVEHEGGLMCVCTAYSTYFEAGVSIFKLNESDMVWENVYTLGDYALFVSVPTSFVKKSVLDMMKNKVFFSLLHKNYLVFYSLETKAFHTYGSNLCENKFYKTHIASDDIKGCWIEPREICCREIGY